MQPIIETTVSSCSSPVFSSRERVELGARGWREAEGLEPICQLFRVALRKLNKDLVLSVKGGGGFREHRLEVHFTPF